MAAIVGGVVAVAVFVLMLLRRIFRTGEPDTVEDETGSTPPS